MAAEGLQRRLALVQALADGAWHSGETIAAAMGVSRTAVWKHAAHLPDWGLELESAALARIDTLRAAAQQRRDSASQELTALRSKPAKAAGLPQALATLLCIGFALALEVVPALILCALRPAPVTETAPVRTPERQKHAEERTQEHPETEPETPAGTDLPAELLQLIARTESGAKLAVRQVAKELRMGSERTTRLMQQATEAGLLSKTAAGYVAA